MLTLSLSFVFGSGFAASPSSTVPEFLCCSRLFENADGGLVAALLVLGTGLGVVGDAGLTLIEGPKLCAIFEALGVTARSSVVGLLW
jgi:hypothetical protein